MALIDMKNVCLSYGGPALLDGVDLTIEPGERVCLLGRNGEGKSSLIKIISGDLLPDKGEITRAQGLRQGVLEQEVPGAMPGTVFDVVAGGIGGLGRLVAEYHACIARMAGGKGPNLTRSLGEIQHRLEIQGGWQLDRNVTSVISRLELSPQASFARGLGRAGRLLDALAFQFDGGGRRHRSPKLPH